MECLNSCNSYANHLLLCRKSVSCQGVRRIRRFSANQKGEKNHKCCLVDSLVSLVYAVFLPLQLGTAWLYSGLLIYLFGMVFIVIAVLNFASSPKGKVITKGLYSASRNPMYLGLLLMQIGLGIACSSWVYLLLTVVLMILLNANLSAEERYCLHRYGDDYQKYKNKTPRWIGIPKSQKKD